MAVQPLKVPPKAPVVQPKVELPPEPAIELTPEAIEAERLKQQDEAWSGW